MICFLMKTRLIYEYYGLQQQQTMHNKCIIYLFLITMAIFIVECDQPQTIEIPDPTECQNYYSQINLPDECLNSNLTCSFDQGFIVLVVKQVTTKNFLLCIDLPLYDIQIVPNVSALTQRISSLFIYSQSIYFGAGYGLSNQNGLYIIANQTALFESITFESSKIWIYANQIMITKSDIFNESLLQTNCNCVDQKNQCEQWDFRYPLLFNSNRSMITDFYNYSNLTAQISYLKSPLNSVTIAGQVSVICEDSIIHFSVIGIFSAKVVLNKTLIDTSGLGYAASYGAGCGYFDEVLHQLLNCMGTGGSHGGFGGNSSPQNCYLLMSKPPYGSIQFPYAPGSGGGFFIPESKESSSGGGVVNIQCSILSLNQTQILSQGKNGIQGGGGGAGGAISLQFLNFTTSNSSVSANGGNGQKSSSGSGGRIRYFNHNWKIEVSNNDTQGVTISSNGGSLCPRKLSCGQNGSIFSSPCRPGYQLANTSYICKKCNVGYYQLTYGYSYCVPCSNPPLNSQFNITNSNSLDYESSCAFQCDLGYYNYTPNSCLTPQQQALKVIGGYNTIISISIIVAAVILYFLAMVVRKLSQNQQFSLGQNSLADALLQRRYFRMEDIPFHELRLYVDGSNNPFNPWKITTTSQINFYAELKNPVTKINHILQRALKEINELSKYSKIEKTIVLVFRYLYYPLSHFILQVLRRNKAKRIFSAISNINRRIPDFQNLAIKFNMKPQMTVCSLEVFNYTRSVLDFYIQNYYPLFFMLEKAPFGGYALDFSDPFLKVFINEISERDSTEGKAIQNFLKEVNKHLKNPNQFVTLLNYLWSLKDIFPHLQAYLWQPPNHILGVNKDYCIDNKKPLFFMINSENINNRHFIFSENLPLSEAQIYNQKRDCHRIIEKYCMVYPKQLQIKYTLCDIGSYERYFSTTNNDFVFFANNFSMVLSFIFYYGLFVTLESLFSTFRLFYPRINTSLLMLFNSILLPQLSLITSLSTQMSIISIMFVWLAMLLISVLTFINQIMLRARIIDYK